MATLAQLSATMARRAHAHAMAHGAQRHALAAALAQHAQYQLQQQQARSVTTTRVLAKRRGGNSAFVVKSSKFRGGGSGSGLKTKDKLKAGVAPHKTHLESMRALQSRGQENARNARVWDELEQDAALHGELDKVFDYLKNLGPDGDYVYQRDPSLRDLDDRDVLAKLNALARGDPQVLAEVNERIEEQQRDHAMLAALGGQQEQEDLGSEALRPAASHELSVDDYNFLMRVYAEKGLGDEANALLSRMEKNLRTAVSPFATAAAAAAPAPAPAATTAQDTVTPSSSSSLDDVPHRIAPDAKTYMYYIISLVDSGASAPAAAVRTLGRMKERGVQPDVHTYNSVMNVCAKGKKTQWAYNIMEKMQLAGLMPDKASFTILMHAAIADGEIDKAFETFHLMRSRVTDPDVVAFTVLIHGFAKIGRIERAINLYEDLLDCGLTPTHMTFNSLILACAKSHYFAHKAVEFYHEMQELYDYHPDPFTYNNVLHACAKHGDFIQAEQILRHMTQHEVPIDERAYNTLLNVYARAQIKKVVAQAPRNKAAPPPLEQLYQEPLEFDEDGKEIDLTRPFKDVSSLKNWNYDGTFDEEEEEVDDEIDALDHDDDEYEDDADTEAEDGMSAEDRAELERIRQQDQNQNALLVQSPPASDPFTEELTGRAMDLSHFGRLQTQSIARAEELLAEMTQDKKLPASVVTLTSMLSVYANALRLQRAERFFAEAFAAHDVEPNEHTYRTMMQMYVRAKRTHKAEALLREITHKIEDGALRADRITLGLLVDHYARQRMLRKALVLLEQADELHVQLEERHLKKVRQLTERFGIFTELIPEDPFAVIHAGSRAKLMEKRKVRAQVLAYNQKVGKKFLLPASVKE